MKNKLIVTSIIIATLWIAGCESNQEKATRLGKIANDLERQYRRECFDPSQSENASSINNALLGKAPTAQEKAEAEQQARAQETRIASPHCQDLKARKTAAGQAWAAALNASSH